ncbi:MAG TPA: hypothetical protein VFK97_00945 [Candidatus Saccharimonadales bacterium]|nr:hypothetical protein [Candidatus Saccharimonadales bacterium]
MELKPRILTEIGPAAPEIELANVDLLREAGEVSPLVLNVMEAYYSARQAVRQLRRPPTPTTDYAPKRSQRNAGVAL